MEYFDHFRGETVFECAENNEMGVRGSGRQFIDGRFSLRLGCRRGDHGNEQGQKEYEPEQETDRYGVKVHKELAAVATALTDRWWMLARAVFQRKSAHAGTEIAVLLLNFLFRFFIFDGTVFDTFRWY
jgi:hypothetical protein